MLSSELKAAAVVELLGQNNFNVKVDTLAGETLTIIKKDDGTIMVGNAKLGATDVEAKNGVIHLVCSLDTALLSTHVPLSVLMHSP